jgi:hypothetical protein
VPNRPIRVHASNIYKLFVLQPQEELDEHPPHAESNIMKLRQRVKALPPSMIALMMKYSMCVLTQQEQWMK